MERPAEIAAFADIDGDGDLAPYLGMSTRVESAGTELPAFFLNDGSDRFALGTERRTVRWPDSAGTSEAFVLPAGHRFELHPSTRPRVML